MNIQHIRCINHSDTTRHSGCFACANGNNSCKEHTGCTHPQLSAFCVHDYLHCFVYRSLLNCYKLVNNYYAEYHIRELFICQHFLKIPSFLVVSLLSFSTSRNIHWHFYLFFLLFLFIFTLFHTKTAYFFTYKVRGNIFPSDFFHFFPYFFPVEKSIFLQYFRKNCVHFFKERVCCRVIKAFWKLQYWRIPHP